MDFVVFDLYAVVSILAVSFLRFFIGSSKRVLRWSLFLFIFAYHLLLSYSSFDESDESNEEESEKPGSESGSAGTFGIGLGGSLIGV